MTDTGIPFHYYLQMRLPPTDHMKNIQEYHYKHPRASNRSIITEANETNENDKNLEIKQPNTRERAKQEKEREEGRKVVYLTSGLRGGEEDLASAIASAVPELDLVPRPAFSPSPRTSNLLPHHSAAFIARKSMWAGLRMALPSRSGPLKLIDHLCLRMNGK